VKWKNRTVFYTADAEGAMASFTKLILKNIDQAQFKEKFSRKKIMSDMAKDVLEFACNRHEYG